MPINFFARPRCSDSQMRDHQMAWGLYLEDLYSLVPPELQQLVSRYAREECPTRSPSNVSSDRDKFRATVDVKGFKPEEISVRVVENTVVIEGKHEEREDEHGTISRQFVRKYNVGREFDLNRVESRLSLDGVLSLTAPKIASGEEEGTTVIPVIQTEQAASEKKQ